jgi:hypothetical protein
MKLVTGMPKPMRMTRPPERPIILKVRQTREATDGASQNRLGVAATENERHAQNAKAKPAVVGEAEVEPGRGLGPEQESGI